MGLKLKPIINTEGWLNASFIYVFKWCLLGFLFGLFIQITFQKKAADVATQGHFYEIIFPLLIFLSLALSNILNVFCVECSLWGLLWNNGLQDCHYKKNGLKMSSIEMIKVLFTHLDRKWENQREEGRLGLVILQFSCLAWRGSFQPNRSFQFCFLKYCGFQKSTPGNKIFEDKCFCQYESGGQC